MDTGSDPLFFLEDPFGFFLWGPQGGGFVMEHISLCIVPEFSQPCEFLVIGGHADMPDDTLSRLTLFIMETLDDLDRSFLGIGGCFGSDNHGHEKCHSETDKTNDKFIQETFKKSGFGVDI